MRSAAAKTHTRAPARSPALTVDAVILSHREAAPPRACCAVLLIERARPPFAGCWALPGGFVDYGEDPGAAVRREVEEETGLSGLPFRQFQVYGDPRRDPRGHTVTIVYTAELEGEQPAPAPGDDAARAAWFPVDALPDLAFDHAGILNDVLEMRGER